MNRLKVGTIRKVFCNTCGIQTYHELRATSERGKDETKGTEEYYVVMWWENYEYRFWVCQLCSTATLEISYSNMAMQEQEEAEERLTMYPKRAELKPRRFRRFRNKSLKSIYLEVIESYNAELSFSCALGLRALLEGICVDMGVKDEKPTKVLSQKIAALKEEEHGGVRADIVDNLSELRFMGNEAAHQQRAPTEEELRLGIGVLEKLIDYLYKESEHQLASEARRLREKRRGEESGLIFRKKK